MAIYWPKTRNGITEMSRPSDYFGNEILMEKLNININI